MVGMVAFARRCAASIVTRSGSGTVTGQRRKGAVPVT